VSRSAAGRVAVRRGPSARLAELLSTTDAFPAVKSTAFTVFHKFYVDEARSASDSDAFDIIIASAAPYVEAIITENHQAEVLRKTQQLDSFIKDLAIFTLRDFRKAAA
jgi:hypothetical protein